MLKLYRKVLAAGAVALGLAACGDDVTVTNPPPPPPPGVSSVTIAPATITISINQEVVFAASVIADAGVATTVTWNTNNPAIASVDASGKVKGLTVGTTTITATSTADNSKVGVATVTVAGNPPGIVSFGVTPLNMLLAPGQFQQAAAQIVTAFGVATPTVTWGTSNPAVATVSATGTVTAVAAGSAVVTASITVGSQTASATIGVTVRALIAATVSIKSITTGLTTLPVNVGNVFGQIEVTLNFNPGEQIVDSVSVFLGAKRAAKQSFITNPAAGDLVFSINTANFTKNLTAGVATVDYLNGSTTVSAAMYPRGATGTATEATQIVLNNSDGWAADITKPTATATSAAGISFWGGPSPAGNTAATIYPVIYTPGRAISTVTWTLGPGGVAGCATVTQTTLPFTQTFGYTAASTPVGTAQSLCTGYENLGGATVQDNVVITAALDNTSNAYPVVNAVTPLIPDAVVLAQCVPVTAGCVAGATPDSLRIDDKSPVVSVPSITRTAPQVTGWVNGAFSFINFASTDLGVGLRATRDRATQWSSVNCPTVVATNLPMATGTGADINAAVACPTNFIGGAVGLGGTAPWRVRGAESDRLNNAGFSATTATFGTDYTAPGIRWGLVDAVFPLPAAYGGSIVDPVDSTRFQTAVVKVAGAFGEFRAEYLDDRSGFFAAGQPSGGTAAQSHNLTFAGHLSPVGVCQISAVGGVPGATFITNPGCSFTPITVGTAGVRTDGWQAGQRLNVPLPEGYYRYKTWVQDEAGNQSVTLFRGVLINNQSPFSTGLGVPAILTSTNFNFIATFSDSAEILKQSLQVVYPYAAATIDSFRYNQTFLAQLAPAPALAAAFDDFITSPFSGNIAPPTGTPYAHSIEQTTAGVFPATNVNVAGVQAKPTKVLTWAWNPGSLFTPGGPAPGVSPEIPIPGLNVEANANINAFNVANPTIAITHFRIITTVASSNQFGSVVPLRAQVESPTNAPNPPFARVDFYRQVGGAYLSFLGSAPGNVIELSAACAAATREVCGTDQGTYRSWVYQLPGTYAARWDGVAQAAVVSGDIIVAVGVVSTGDALATQTTTMVP